MDTDNASENLTPEQTDLSRRIFNLVIGRIFEKVYNGLDSAGKKKMEEINLSEDKGAKEKFIRKYVPDFAKVFQEELIKVSEEVMEEMKNGL